MTQSPLEHRNITDIKKDFPILEREIHGKPLAFLDSAASSQKPQYVLDAIFDYAARIDFHAIFR